MSKLLSIEDLYVEYAGSPTLRGVSAAVSSGEIVGVVGESGSGKSTMIYAALGILSGEGKVTSGSIKYGGRELLGMDKEELRKLRGSEMSLIAQNPLTSFHPIRKISSQLKDLIDCHPSLSYEEAKEEMIRIMEKISLKDAAKLMDSYAFELSGGMAQRVSIAMSMVLRPKILFADEPTSALDVTSQKQVVGEMMKIRDEFGTSILIVSHNMGVISYMADSIIVMHNGCVVETGKNDQVIRHAAHPYTVNLIAAIPAKGKNIPKGIRSYPHAYVEKGCPYCGVCPRKTDRCEKETPVMTEVSEGHRALCWNVQGREQR